MDRQQLKDLSQEARLVNGRLLVALAGTLLCIVTLLYRLYDLQVVNHHDYVTQSDRNRIQVQALPPTRGLIVDRKGRLLADNRPSYSLEIIKEQTGDLDLTLQVLATLVAFDAEDVDAFEERLKRRRPYESVPLIYNLSEEDIARLSVNQYRLPGVKVSAQLVRDYPYADLFAHVVGYVGRINDRELTGFDSEQNRRYSGTHTIGKIGLEKQYESQLLGEVGYQYVESNARGRVLRTLEQIAPQPGENLRLFLDADLQYQAVQALAGRRGAVVAIELDTGGVLAMVSAPAFDPNLFVTGIDYDRYRALNDSLDLPLFNRAIQGQYPPGSTLKPMLGLAGLFNGAVTLETTVYDPGFFQLKGEKRLYRDWKRQGHGTRVDLLQAITESCDTYFYEMAYRMGIDELYEFGTHFALGQKTGIDIPSERAGLWPSRQWKRGARGLPWYPGDTVNVGIGQGFVLTTPLQLAAMTATLANRGKNIQPRFVKTVGDTEYRAREIIFDEVSDSHWDFLFSAMEDVVHDIHGTAYSVGKALDFRMAGKTGTAQVVGIAQGEKYDSEALLERQRDHALFVAFAPLERPQIAVAVIVENGEKSSRAAQVAQQVIGHYLAMHSETESAEVLHAKAGLGAVHDWR